MRYAPLYLAPFVARRLVAEEIDASEDLLRMGLDAQSLVVAPPDLSAFL